MNSRASNADLSDIVLWMTFLYICGIPVRMNIIANQTTISFVGNERMYTVIW